MRATRVILAVAILAAAMPIHAASDEGPIVGTVWRWSRVLGIDPIEVEHPGRYTLELHPDGRYGVRADCNRAGGAYTLEGERLRLAPGPATAAECGEGSHGTRFLALLGEVEEWGRDGDRLVLTLARDTGTMELAAARAVTLPGTSWLIRGVNDGREAVVSVLGGSVLTARFGADGQLVGSAGCNRYAAGYTLEGDTLAIGPAATTRKMCAEPEGVMVQESALLAALATVSTWRVEGERLQLRTASGALAVDAIAVVTGVVTYRVRSALPADAEVRVRLEDVSRADAPAILLGEQVFGAEGRQVPLPFEIVFDPADIDPRHSYSLRAEIRDPAGRVLFRTTHTHPVITREGPSFDVEVVLDPAPVGVGH